MIRYQQLVDPCSKIIKDAGKLLLEIKSAGLQVQAKDLHDVVTNADRQVEDYLKTELLKLTPGVGFIAEESGSLAADYQWVIDPLDGTNNAIAHIPFFCISVALTYKSDPLLGFVYDPHQDEFFHAVKNQGAYLDSTKLEPRSSKELSQAILLVSLGKNVDLLAHLIKECKTYRQLGSAALSMAYVAAGRGEVVCLANPQWWDIAAGQILLQETGLEIIKKTISLGSQQIELLISGV